MLIYPRAIFPSQSNRGSPDTPWFIVFKPCPVSLLHGAVPVGRVMSCVDGIMPAAHDSGNKPFDATVLRHFQARCGTEKCSVGVYNANVSIIHCNFASRVEDEDM